MQLLSVIPFTSNQTSNPELMDCFLNHLKNLSIPFWNSTSHNQELKVEPKLIIDALEKTNSPVAVVDTSLRFLVKPEVIVNLKCDIALFSNPRSKMQFFDSSFILFKPNPKTFFFLKNWENEMARSRDKDFMESFCSLLKKEALYTQILPLNPLLKKEAVDDSPFFLRWFLKV